MQNTHNIRFAIDTGGTFTDIVVMDEDTGNCFIEKVPTTPGNTIRSVINAINKAKIDLSKVESFFIHGSTTAMNCLIERKGAKTAYITTKGFRDVPEIARYDRPELYNIKYKKTPPPVPRNLRFEVRERLNHKGEVLVPLQEDDVREVARIIKQKQVESVAICFLHPFKNPGHEIRAREIVLEECPGTYVSISSDIAGEHKEYERSMTTILDAYLKSTIQSWVSNLEKELIGRGFKGRLIIARSDGGGMTSEAALQNPISTLLSGPSGGVTGGLYFANNLHHNNLVTLDLGGTSCDVCVIKDGQAMMKREARIGDWRILLSTMDINTIGAGGGSIAWIDAAGALHVGPQSAGADPGPICYGIGGKDPTLTDAALCTGYINPQYFLGGDMKLDIESARNGIENKIAKHLNVDVDSAAGSILRIALSNMIEAIRQITIERGEDPRDFELLCYGGAGPLFGAYLVHELDMPGVIIPVATSTFSAWGMLMVDIRHDFALTVTKALEQADLVDINNKLDELIKKGQETLDSERVSPNDRLIYRYLDMRYADQEHTVSVPIDFEIDNSSRDRIFDEFTKVYKQIWGYVLEGQKVEILHLRVTTIGKVSKARLVKIEEGNGRLDSAFKESHRVYDMLNRKRDEFRIYERARLRAGDIINGPAIVEEPTSLSTIPENFKCEVDRAGNLIITRKGS